MKELLTRMEFFGDLDYKKFHKTIPGRQYFLAEQKITPTTKELIHAASYSTKEEEVLEIYVDQICKAAAYNFPSKAIEVAVSMLTEELLGQICLTEMKAAGLLEESRYSERWVKEL